jgi:hypothetical protein
MIWSGQLENPRGIYLHAHEFERAAQLLGESEHRVQVISACVSNCAFSLELYLKCLLHLESGTYPDDCHALLTLFGALSLRHRQRIEELYLEFQINKLKQRRYRRFYSLHELLSISNRGFVEWRYSFEDKNKKLHFCAGVIIPSVKRVIAEVCPIFPSDEPVSQSLLNGVQVI